MKQLIELTPEKFSDIYTDESFRNDVAFAHSSCNSRGELIHKKTCSYPIEYIVTDDQIKEAEIKRQQAKKNTVKANKNKLMFVGMGMSYRARYLDDVCNHRIRTEFKNIHGNRFFIEFGTATGNKMRIDHAVDRDMETLHNAKSQELSEQRETLKRYSEEWDNLSNQIETWNKQTYYNYKGLERERNLPTYTKANILKLVNEYFDCKFTEIIIDNYNVSTEDFTCISPK